MGKLLKVLAKEKADKGFDILRDIYERRKANSMNPDELLNREIEVHELLFDEKRLPLNPLVSSNYRPLKSKGLIYTDGDIIRIREAYFRYVVNDADISMSGQVYKSKNGLYRKRPPDDFEIHYYSEAVQRYNYLKYLKQGGNQDNEIQTLKDACKGSGEYEYLRTWFVDNGLCDPVTFIWKDRKTGYMKKLTNYLKDLEIKGYTRKLNDTEIQNIAKNDFGVEIGISTIQHNSKPESEIPSFH